MERDDPAIPIDPDLVDGGRHRPALLLAVSLGGMVGATARYSIARSFPTHAGRFPWATLATNLAGSFLLGLLLVLILEHLPSARYLRAFVATGALGAFTTMSTFEVEMALLVKDGEAAVAVLYALVSAVAGLALAYAGIVVARHLTVHRSPVPA